MLRLPRQANGLPLVFKRCTGFVLGLRDVKERTQRVKISDWETIDKIDKAKLLDNIVEKLKQRKMPMPIYFITQSNAKMSDADRKAIVNWAEIFTEELFDNSSLIFCKRLINSNLKA